MGFNSAFKGLTDRFTVTQLVDRFTVFIQPGNPSKFHQRSTIEPHSEPLEDSLHLHSYFRKTSGEGQLAGCTESDNRTACSIKCGEFLDS